MRTVSGGANESATALDAACAGTGWPPLQLKSLWMWDQAVDAGPAGEPSKVAPGTSKPRLTTDGPDQ
jgi:hypothetical protein